jgi:c-di-GMP-related signal transduction protein
VIVKKAKDGSVNFRIMKKRCDCSHFITKAFHCRNIVLMRSVNTMIEFKQIVACGTRLFDG